MGVFNVFKIVQMVPIRVVPIQKILRSGRFSFCFCVWYFCKYKNFAEYAFDIYGPLQTCNTLKE